jgi:hypothetical protein
VDIGPESYKVFKNGDRLVIRFSVGQMYTLGKRAWTYGGNWFVWDMDTGQVAAKTSKHGYETKEEAMDVARRYRDEYGAYVRFGF